MKWLLMVLLSLTLFVTGAFVGIHQNSQKYKEETAAVSQHENKQSSVKSTAEISAKTDKKEAEEKPGEQTCVDQKQEKRSAPFIVKIAVGLGEGVSACFDMVVLILSQFIHAG
ncbi:hypothetical protein MUN89_10690 [Halobacillus salinarum]|uniref:Uncharacterized protein n=1 Tax=Halobacillus salinarum TaxID=2932257 RepID=A0ABY4EVY9_9BACI|nr:hypothetical protein [Halobacillus salinarum]UOQ46331.1 hypothetical protein MUN89_10690 [Halobacillus salinarum]